MKEVYINVKLPQKKTETTLGSIEISDEGIKYLIPVEFNGADEDGSIFCSIGIEKRISLITLLADSLREN